MELILTWSDGSKDRLGIADEQAEKIKSKFYNNPNIQINYTVHDKHNTAIVYNLAHCRKMEFLPS